MTQLRTTAQRHADVLAMLESGGHGWLATASAGGLPHMIVVAVAWDGGQLVVATRSGTPTARNLGSARRAWLAVGTPDDVVMIDVEVVAEEAATYQARFGPTFVARAGWDPADEGPDWRYFQLRPVRIDAYRGYGELEGREVMRGGRWLA